MSDKPKLVLDECFTPSSSSVHSNEENKITIKENSNNECSAEKELTNNKISNKEIVINKNIKNYSYDNSHHSHPHEHIFEDILHVDYNHGNTHYQHSHYTDPHSKYIKNKYGHHNHGHHKHGHHKHGHHKHGHHKHGHHWCDEHYHGHHGHYHGEHGHHAHYGHPTYGHLHNGNNCSVPGVVIIKIHKMIYFLIQIKIITIQACTLLRSNYHQKFTILKLKNIFSLVDELNAYIYENLSSTLDEELLKPTEINYQEILDKPFSLNNYIEILRIVDKCIYQLKKILKNI